MAIFNDIVEGLHSLLDLYVSLLRLSRLEAVQEYHYRIDDTIHQPSPTSSCLVTYLEDIDVISL